MNTVTDLTPEQFDQVLSGALALSDRRLELSKRVPACPACGEAKQVQLVDWTTQGPAQWRCRSCWHGWEGE